MCGLIVWEASIHNLLGQQTLLSCWLVSSHSTMRARPPTRAHKTAGLRNLALYICMRWTGSLYLLHVVLVWVHGSGLERDKFEPRSYGR